MGKRVAVISTEGKPWAMYARLSKAARAVDEDGTKVGDLEKVEYQIEMCRNYATNRDLPVSDGHVYIDPSLSAWKRGVKRPQWDEMMGRRRAGRVGRDHRVRRRPVHPAAEGS